MIAVILHNHRFPGDVPVAVAALTGSAVGVLAVGPRVARLTEGDWRTLLFVGVVVRSGCSRSGRPRWPWLRYRRSTRPCFRRCAAQRSRGDDRDQPDPAGVGATRPGCSIAESPTATVPVSICCVGVALRRSTGRPVAVSITGPSTRMGAGRLDKLGRRLREVLQASAPPSFTVAPPVESTDDLYG
jgi:hypothetical protein